MPDPARRLALVLGGAVCVWDDALTALALASPDAVLAINDMVPLWPGPVAYAVTLHPQKMAGWLAERAANGFDPPAQVWAHRPGEGVTHVGTDWQGSSGLFAAKIATYDEGFAGVILAGVPLDGLQSHFVRQRPWSSASAFLKGWRFHMAAIKPRVRSLGGWTREQLGAPTPEWLAQIDAAPSDPALIERIRLSMEQSPP